MRNILALLLALTLLLSLAACGERGEDPAAGETNDPGTSQSEDTADSSVEGLVIDFEAILRGDAAVDTIWGKQDAATKQAIIAEGKKDGVDVSFGADGSMTVVDPENGDTIIQKPDGTWAVKGEDGSEGQYGGEWPENAFTKQLPKPAMELMAATTGEEAFTVAFKDATLEQVKAYVEQVKHAGFTVDPQTEEQKIGEMVIYSYIAKNDAGYTVTVSCAMGISAILVEMP